MELLGSSEKRVPKIVGFSLSSKPTDDGNDLNDAFEQIEHKENSIEFDPTDKRIPSDQNDPDENKYKKKKAEKISTWWSLFILIYLGIIFIFVAHMDQRLPPAINIKESELHPDRFIEERARNHLRKLTSVGARPTGSYENEVLATDFIRRELASLQKQAKPIHKLSIDVQKPRGSFNLGFADGFTHHYQNIQNIVAKLESGHGAKHSLLVNCHFDSVPQSPGASDDAVSCAIMLEIIHVLLQSDVELKHNIVFLFNGAEENMLPASHGFITQHVWAEEVRAFINLEACGSGGRELVFQTGPAHPWLVEAYARVAPHPFASVIGQEIFQSGVIPADTDFRIFRDYGHIPGLDIAYMKNGYVYHTKYDTEDRIPDGSIQRAGDNVLEVVRHLAKSDVLGHTDAHASGSVVFFDVLGLFMVHYPEWVGVLVNLAIVMMSLGITIRKAQNSFQYGVSSGVYMKQLGYTFLTQVIGCIVSIVTVTLVAVFLDAFNKTMSWYSKPYLIFFLYMAPTMMAVIAVLNFALSRQKKFFQFHDGVWVIESMYFEVSKLVWTFYTLVMTLLRLKSSFFCMIWVLFPMSGRFLLDQIYDRTAVKRKPKDWKWLMVHLISVSVPLILNMYLIYTTFAMFVPIMGRAGSAINPDLLIGYKAASMALATMSFLCPLVMVMRKPNNVISTLYMSTIITVILVITTRLGFPYSSNPKSVAPHRSLILHTSREFYNKEGNKTDEDSGYFLLNLDRNSPRVLMNIVPEFMKMQDVTEEQCQEHLYCGIPIYYPCSTMLRINHWIESKKPRVYQETGLTLLHTETPSIDTIKLLFEAKGPDHMGIYFSPAVGIRLKSWSFSNGKILDGPSWKDERPTYYIFHSHGISPTPWQFWIEFQVPRSYRKENYELMDLAISGHITHGSGMKSPEFKQFLDQFPAWSYPVGWTATYKSFKF